MNNLYVIAIGGSGERVMRSLILTLASGVKINAKQVIPVFVDNDVNSNAFLKCMDLIKFYAADPSVTTGFKGVNESYKSISGDQSEWPSFCNTKIGQPIVLNKAGSSIGNLAKIIGNIKREYGDDKAVYDRIVQENELIFSADDMAMPLDVGFVGNPNIGSVVLNSLSLADEGFKNICDSTSPTDGVIVVGSLFGGTGAAGLPLIINSINEAGPSTHPILGAVAILPYFTTSENGNEQNAPIDKTKWNVEPDSFDTKTRAALMYYDDYMRDMDYMYYIGDGDAKEVHKHCVGGEGQANPAHLVELLGAMSIIDFAKQGKPDKIVYKMPVWGCNEQGTDKIPSNLSGISNPEIKKALAKFRMMREIFFSPDLLKWAIDEKKEYVKNIGFDEVALTEVTDPKNAKNNQSNAWGLNNLIQEWTAWMDELGKDGKKRQFQIYNSSAVADDKTLTHHFYADRELKDIDKGIAKTLEKGLWKKTKVADEAKVAEALLAAYKEIFKKAPDVTSIPQEKRLPLMLKIISRALDKVLDEHCIAM